MSAVTTAPPLATAGTASAAEVDTLAKMGLLRISIGDGNFPLVDVDLKV